MEKPLLIEHNIRVFSYDIDGMSIVSNIVYIRWFEELRTYFLDKYLPFETMMTEGYSPILQKTTIDYKHPITLQDKPLGKAWIKEMGRAKWVCGFEIWVGDKLHAKGEQQGYFFSMARKRLIPVPKELSDAYNLAVQTDK